MATYLDTVNPPVAAIGVDPAYNHPWNDDYHLNGGEAQTLGGRSWDYSVEVLDIGPLVFLYLTSGQRASLKALYELKTTLYLKLPDDGATVFTGSIPDMRFTPETLGDGSIVWTCTFTFKCALAP